MFSLKRGRIALTVLLSALLVFSAGILCSAHATGPQLEVTSEPKTGETFTGLSDMARDGDVYLYNWRKDAARTWDLTIPGEAFTHGALTLKVSLPEASGMCFTSNTVANLLSLAQVDSARFLPSGTRYGVQVTFKEQADPASALDLLLSLSTEATGNMTGKAAQAAEDGKWPDTQVSFVMSSSDGEVDFSVIFIVRLESGSEPEIAQGSGISVSSSALKEPLNHILGGLNYYGGGFTLPLYAYNDTELMIFDELRVYLPEPANLFYNGSFDNNGVGFRQYYGNYITWSSDGQRHTDSTGTYYSLTPDGRPNGVVNIIGAGVQTTFEMYGNGWRVSGDLEPDTVYQAPDTVMVCHGTSGTKTYSIPGTGMKIITLPRVEQDDWLQGFIGNSFKKNGASDSYSRLSAGSRYEYDFSRFWNMRSYVQGGTEYVSTLDGRTVERYEFPEEILPEAFIAHTEPVGIFAVEGSWGFGIESVSYTVANSAGSERTLSWSEGFDSKTADEARFELDLTDGLVDGERVTSLTVTYSYIQGIKATQTNNSIRAYPNVSSGLRFSIEIGAEGLVQIAYSARSTENGKSVSAADRLWIKIIDPPCPYLGLGDGTGGLHRLDDTDVWSTTTHSNELIPQGQSSAGSLILFGVQGGRTVFTDPRFDLALALYNEGSFVNAPGSANIFLSGGMTLSKVMAGFTVEYSYTDGSDTYEKTYDLPEELEGDLVLTREALGLGERDLILSLALTKQGSFDISDSYSHTDAQGYFRYIPVKSVALYYSTTDENGEVLEIKPVTTSTQLPYLRLQASFTHSSEDNCSRASEHTAGSASMKPGTKNQYLFTAKNYELSVAISGSASNTSVSQGASAGFTISVPNTHKGITVPDYSYGNDGNYIDFGVPETIYIEIADPQFEADLSNAAFLRSLSVHMMDTEDVRMIELSDGRRFLCLTSDENNFYIERVRFQNSNSSPITNVVFNIALKAWKGAYEGAHNPFGDVYYDLGDMADYDGSADAGYQHVVLSRTVADEVTAELTGDAQRQLWKADLSGISIRVTRATEVGCSMGYVSNGILQSGRSVVFRKSGADDLMATTTMTSPEGLSEVTNFVWTEKLPRKANGAPFDLFMTGPAYTHNSSLTAGSTVTYSYSADGENFVSESSVTDWDSVVYIRTHVDRTEAITSLETRYPLRAEKDYTGPTQTASISGEFSYEISGQSVPTAVMGTLDFKYEDSKYYILNWLQAGGVYAADPSERLTMYGTAGDTAAHQPLSSSELPGYAFDASEDNYMSGAIEESDDLELRFYYKQQFTVSYVHGADSDQDESYCGLDWGALLPRYSGEPTRSGWYFLGWNTELDGSGVSPDDFANGQGAGPAQGGACVTEDLTFYARWTPNSSIVVPAAAAYKVEHWRQQPDGNYELYDTEFPLVGELGSTVDAAVRDLAAEHYLAEPNAQLSVLRGTVVMPSVSVGQEGQAVLETLVLKVYYDLDEHSLSYDANDASYPGAPEAAGSMAPLTRLHGSTVNVAGECGFTREGWLFAGWNTEADGSGDAAAAGSPVLLEEDITLYALWIPESSPIQPMAAAYKTEHWRQQPDESYELYETEFPLVGALGDTVDASVRDYSDEHYLTEPNEALSVLSGVVVMPSVPAGAPAGSETQILVLSVYYDLDMHSLSYDANDASYPSAPAAAGSMDAVIRLHGNTADAAYECGFEREGWVFTGWNTEADGSGDAVPGGTAVMLDEDVTLYARWIPKSSEIVPRAAVFRTEHYRQQPGGSYELYETEFPLVGELGSTVNASVKDYSGEHYRRIPNAELSKLSGVVVMPSVPAGAPAGSEPEILVLKVYYDLEEHCLSYDANDASYPSAPSATGSMPSVCARHGETVETAENGFSRTGWVFDGWTEDAEGRVPIRATSGAFILTEDVIFYAQWIPKSTPVTPQTAAYKVEHWRENADGKYELYETEFPLYAAIGENVNAAAKDYTADGYLAEPNAQRSITSGRVSMPETVIGSGGKEEVKILTLKLYYDRKPQPKPSYAPEKLETEKHFAYIEGYPDGSVRPEDAITRAEISTIFYRLLKDSVRSSLAGTACSFTDVEEGDWFYDAVAAMSELGIVNGYPDGSFRPSEKISRAELTAMAVRFDETEKAAKGNFYDVIGHWAQSDIAKAVENGWVKGYEDGSFKPDASITRAEAIALINRVLGRKLADEDGVIGDMIVATDNQDRGKWYWLDIQEAMNDHEYTMKSGGNEKWVKLIR